jgi:two-component system chemotaxis sensor kinase CheA
VQDEAFIQSFVEESKAHIETIEKELINLDFDQIDMESINGIFRAVHTIKGTSGFFDFKKIVSLSHAFENLFGEIRSGNIKITNDMVDELLKVNDCLKEMIEDVANSESVEITGHVDAIKKLLNSSNTPTSKAKDSVRSLDKSEKIENQEDGVDEYFDVDNYLSPSAKRTLLQEELRFGARVYLLTRKLYGDMMNNHVNLIELLKEIESLGSVIDLNMDFRQILEQANGDENDAQMKILFTTVLEKDFLPEIIGLPEEQVVELSMNPILASEGLMTEKDENIELEVQLAQKQLETKQNKQTIITSINDVKMVEPVSIAKAKGQTTVEDSVRVNVTLLNNLLNLSGEMVLARNQLFRKMEVHRKKIPEMDNIFQNINHITTNLQETIMLTRMQPVSNVFNKFPRIVRELSRKLEKDIALELEGIEVELDKSIIEALVDPLTHLVRNAIDHGIEIPDNRIQTGKPRTGTLILKAYHESGYVNIDIIDDGKGIDIEIIKKIAFDKGFITTTDLESMGEQKSLQLLFKPGFSTAETVTDISGRGVGMDVVKTNIEKLGGKIEIFTNLGKGTTFRLLLPLTLAIIPSLIVEVEQQKFALPQINVQEIVRIKADDAGRKIEYINHSEVLRLRGKLLPIVRLADVLGIPRTYIEPLTGDRKKDKREKIFHYLRQSELEELSVPSESDLPDERRGYKLTNIVRVIVIKIGSRRLGLAVDTIHGSEEILVKTISIHIQGCNNYSGVTILGDGKVAMILDPSGIIENSNLHYMEDRFEVNNKSHVSEVEKMRENQSLLLFKCSGPETLVLDMSLVSRVEEIASNDIEVVGDKEFIQFRDEPLRIIRPEDFIDISKKTTDHMENHKCYVIIPKLVKHPMGILIESVQDTMLTSIKLNQNDNVTAKGIVGSTILSEKIVLLLNIYELFELANPEQYSTVSKTKKGKQMKILLVEDTPFFQKLEKGYLENAGYHVTLAENGKIALNILQKKTFDIIVSDINMPEMDGIELVKRIRADSALANLPVIAVTSLTGELQKQEGLEAGFDAYEFKLDRTGLIDVLESTLKKRG